MMLQTTPGVRALCLKTGGQADAPPQAIAPMGRLAATAVERALTNPATPGCRTLRLALREPEALSAVLIYSPGPVAETLLRGMECAGLMQVIAHLRARLSALYRCPLNHPAEAALVTCLTATLRL